MSFREKSAWVTLITLVALAIAFELAVHSPWTLSPTPGGREFDVLIVSIVAFVTVEIVAYVVLRLHSPRDARTPKKGISGVGIAVAQPDERIAGVQLGGTKLRPLEVDSDPEQTMALDVDGLRAELKAPGKRPPAPPARDAPSEEAEDDLDLFADDSLLER